ncbi:nondiscriminating aspartyl-tRNA synthetase [Kibdelosporangium banguiense]|uniref:Aspartate--tRNA(Asp/Asn) ligase n=1 Tax=Kibdelosporangium banguiense TaxID=1365924 RepID=A0ABS4U014_9PSEU|nr:aspartate--tRNA(Asn) ligase [Kibdelosporangium banguiense]MBP2329992.1 nondiscriminating aspartyl-tRNA synthetase [Kibdelosporangium banguiense]
MITRILAADVPRHIGSRVRTAGWIHRRRELKSVTFLVIRDRSGLVQVVLTEPVELTEETVVQVEGMVTASEQAPGGAEITQPVITVLSEPAKAPPFDLYRPRLSATLPTILDNAPVALRHPGMRAQFAITAASVAGFRAALDAQGFTEIHTPKIVGTVTESGANVFGIDYFGRRAYLAQSPQLFKQSLVGVFERVYEVGPVFRAEPHDTTRHLAQYTSLDAELGFITDHHDVMAVLTETLRTMVSTIGERLPEVELPVVPAEIPEIHFANALALIGAQPDEPDLAPAHERSLSDWALRTHDSEFLYVTGYPMRKRPFYTHPEPGRPDHSNSFDLLFRGVELVTGGQRLHSYADYLAVLPDPEPYRSYLDAFAYGMPPHGGFALGLERWTARLVGAANIRQTTLFPRDLNRLSP